MNLVKIGITSDGPNEEGTFSFATLSLASVITELFLQREYGQEGDTHGLWKALSTLKDAKHYQKHVKKS